MGSFSHIFLDKLEELGDYSLRTFTLALARMVPCLLLASHWYTALSWSWRLVRLISLAEILPLKVLPGKSQTLSIFSSNQTKPYISFKTVVITPTHQEAGPVLPRLQQVFCANSEAVRPRDLKSTSTTPYPKQMGAIQGYVLTATPHLHLFHLPSSSCLNRSLIN